MLTSFLHQLWCAVCAAFQCGQHAGLWALCFPGGFTQWRQQEQIRQGEEIEVGAFIHWPPHSPPPILIILCWFVLLWRQQLPGGPWHIETLTSSSWSFRPRDHSGSKDVSLETTFHCWLLYILPTTLWLVLLLNLPLMTQPECHLFLPWILTKTKTKIKKQTPNQSNKVLW